MAANPTIGAFLAQSCQVGAKIIGITGGADWVNHSGKVWEARQFWMVLRLSKNICRKFRKGWQIGRIVIFPGNVIMRGNSLANPFLTSIQTRRRTRKRIRSSNGEVVRFKLSNLKGMKTCLEAELFNIWNHYLSPNPDRIEMQSLGHEGRFVRDKARDSFPVKQHPKGNMFQ